MSSNASHGVLDVLVVGAGPTGLALAAELAAFGVDFRLVDRQADRVHESRALAVQPRTLEVLAAHGVAEQLVAAGNPAVGLCMHTGRRVVSLRLFDLGPADTAYPFLLFVSQAETERLLGEHLSRRGVRIERGVSLVGMYPAGDAVSCRLRYRDGGEETVRARYVVGCDGAGSTVRDLAGIGFTGHRYPQTFLLADLEANGLEPGAVHSWLGDAGMLFLFPLGAPATWRLLAMRPPGDPDTDVTLDRLQAITDRYTGGTVRLHAPVWLTRFRLHNRGATSYRAERVFVAGDAAHVHSPAGAQGMNTGIQDAVNLGWKLALACRGTAHPALLDSYHAERAPVGRAVRRLSDRAFTVATTRNPLVRLARTHLVPRVAPLAMRWRPGRAAAFRTIAQLSINYRDSPLSTDGPGVRRRGPRAGDRLPDAPVALDGRQTTLHAALCSGTPGYRLLLCGPASGEVGEVGPWPVTVHRLSRDREPGVLHDGTGVALRRLGATPVHYLVRPDGHIAYRSAGLDLTGVRAYLSRWLTPLP
jgi:2-polyprenyl-6-methoxyphenol hydroxylase-like FAD-dependent oxidoreductase